MTMIRTMDENCGSRSVEFSPESTHFKPALHENQYNKLLDAQVLDISRNPIVEHKPSDFPYEQIFSNVDSPTLSRTMIYASSSDSSNHEGDPLITVLSSLSEEHLMTTIKMGTLIDKENDMEGSLVGSPSIIVKQIVDKIESIEKSRSRVERGHYLHQRIFFHRRNSVLP